MSKNNNESGDSQRQIVEKRIQEFSDYLNQNFDPIDYHEPILSGNRNGASVNSIENEINIREESHNNLIKLLKEYKKLKAEMKVVREQDEAFGNPRELDITRKRLQSKRNQVRSVIDELKVQVMSWESVAMSKVEQDQLSAKKDMQKNPEEIKVLLANFAEQLSDLAYDYGSDEQLQEIIIYKEAVEQIGSIIVDFLEIYQNGSHGVTAQYENNPDTHILFLQKLVSLSSKLGYSLDSIDFDYFDDSAEIWKKIDYFGAKFREVLDFLISKKIIPPEHGYKYIERFGGYCVFSADEACQILVKNIEKKFRAEQEKIYNYKSIVKKSEVKKNMELILPIANQEIEIQISDGRVLVHIPEIPSESFELEQNPELVVLPVVSRIKKIINDFSEVYPELYQKLGEIDYTDKNRLLSQLDKIKRDINYNFGYCNRPRAFRLGSERKAEVTRGLQEFFEEDNLLQDLASNQNEISVLSGLNHVLGAPNIQVFLKSYLSGVSADEVDMKEKMKVHQLIQIICDNVNF